MLTPSEKQRYSRQTILPEIGEKGQVKLKSARVLIIGAGGLGCPVLQYLSAAGIGTIGIADGDTIEESNLQRQILYTSQDIGKYKAPVAKEKAEALNPFITIVPHVMNVAQENILSLIENYDIIVDGTDNFATRYLINDACVMANKPWVFGSIFKFEGQVSVFNYQNGPTYRCIFPEQPGVNEMPNCAVIGVVATLPGIVGSLQANEVIRMITGIGEVLSGRLLVIDALQMQLQTFSFNVVEKNKQITGLTSGEYPSECYNDSGIQWQVLQQRLLTEKIQLVDVREPDEHAVFNIGGMNIPLSQLATDNSLLNNDQAIVLYCASGMRSKKAAAILTAKGFTNILSLQDGIRHLLF